MIEWDFTGRHALVTGGSRGIGRETVIRLARSGATVHFTYAGSAGPAKKLAGQLTSEGLRVFAWKCDLSQNRDISRLVERFRDEAGYSLDLLVNNAAITWDAPLHDMTWGQWERVLQIDLHALFKVSRYLVRRLAFAGGTMVNVTSMAGLMGVAGQANYSAAKAGMIGFSKALSKELGPLGVRVNCVAPGYIETDMTRGFSEDKRKKLARNTSLRRFGSPGEVADVILFLLSDHSSYITGEVLGVSGGFQ